MSKKSSDASESNRQTGRAETGIPGLNDILHGGLPRNRLYLIDGDPGTGKTTLALQFLLAGAAHGERGVYVTLSETKAELEDVARSHGWSLEAVDLQELSAAQQLIQSQAQQTVFEPSEVELSETSRILLESISKSQPSRVVLDSLSEFRLLAGVSLRYRQQILAMKQFFSQRNCTVLLLDDRTVQTEDRQLHSLVHGVIHLEQTAADFGVDRRRLRVVKMRGMAYREGYHDYLIRKGGLAVFPHLVAAEHREEASAESISSGLTELDRLVGGGLLRSTNVMLVGPAGAGKSTVTAQYAIASAERGEKVAAYLFDERSHTYRTRAAGLGMPLAKHLASGLIAVQQVDPAELSPGQFTQAVRDGVEQDDVRMVIIDGLDGYMTAMPGERFLLLQLHELLTYLAQQSIPAIFTMEQHGMLPTSPMTTSLDVSYLTDTVLMIRFYEWQGEIRRAISCIKKRSGPHEHSIRDLKFTSNGLRLGEPLKEFHGILTGEPIRGGDTG